MTTFPGTVTLEDDQVPVTIGLDNDEVVLVSGQVEIGKWATGECNFLAQGDGTWVIEARDGTLSFLPDDPGGFAKELSGDLRPHPLTLVGFYALALGTLALGVWAFLSMIG